MKNSQLYGGIEAGGTKFVCVVGSGPDHIMDEVRFPTTTPDETLGRVINFFRSFVDSKQINHIGIGCFGPIDQNTKSPTFGFITATPKLNWSNTDVHGTIQRALDVNVAFDMDVNAAALGEAIWGASKSLDPSLYLTIGTGIGGGYIKDGKPLIGMLSLEMGHIRIPHSLERDPFRGACPFHSDCFEGLASGPAIEKRLGLTGSLIREDDPFWEIETDYIASALVNFILTLSPKKIILGGGVMQREFLFPKIRHRVRELLNGYVASNSVLQNVDNYIVPPGLGNQSGSLGAIALAILATHKDASPAFVKD